MDHKMARINPATATHPRQSIFRRLVVISTIFLILLFCSGCETADLNRRVNFFTPETSAVSTPSAIPQIHTDALTPADIPEYAGSPYVIVNDNIPDFKQTELTEQSFEKYSKLDRLGRCGKAYACIGKDLMPTKERDSIGHIRPSGWQLAKYDFIDGSRRFLFYVQAIIRIHTGRPRISETSQNLFRTGAEQSSPG